MGDPAVGSPVGSTVEDPAVGAPPVEVSPMWGPLEGFYWGGPSSGGLSCGGSSSAMRGPLCCVRPSCMGLSWGLLLWGTLLCGIYSCGDLPVGSIEDSPVLWGSLLWGILLCGTLMGSLLWGHLGESSCGGLLWCVGPSHEDLLCCGGLSCVGHPIVESPLGIFCGVSCGTSWIFLSQTPVLTLEQAL